MTAPRSGRTRQAVPPGFRGAPGHDTWLVFVVVGFVICVIGAAATARIEALGWCIAFCAAGALAAAGAAFLVRHKHHGGPGNGAGHSPTAARR